MSGTEMATCRTCGERFPSYRVRVPGARPNATKWGAARGNCGRCEPNDGRPDWAAVAAGHGTVEPNPDEFLGGARA